MRLAWLKDLRLADLPHVGGKNASLGEMIGSLTAAGIRVNSSRRAGLTRELRNACESSTARTSPCSQRAGRKSAHGF
jgi:hypothetical protein